MKEFFVGWHQPNNGASGCRDFERCIISVNRLIDRKSNFAVNTWIMDSGAFTRIVNGVGHIPVEEYAEQVLRWSNCGNLVAAVSQDYMCEPFVLKKTKLSVQEHQQLTSDNYDKLRKLVDERVYIMPVIQGYKVSDYISHLNQYGDKLKYGQWVGVGSVCKRNSSPSQIEEILIAIHVARPDLKLHGFGIKKKSLESSIVWDILYSADSQAHGLAAGRGKNKYVNSNDPEHALNYARSIKSPSQLSIFTRSRI